MTLPDLQLHGLGHAHPASEITYKFLESLKILVSNLHNE